MNRPGKEQNLTRLIANQDSCLQPLVQKDWEAVDQVSRLRRVRAIVDSGASSSCASGDLAPEVETRPSEGSRRGQTYAAASKGGKPLRNEGEKLVNALTGEGKEVATTWQIVDVNRPLMSVHQICKAGNIAVFGQDGGYILNLADGSRTHFGVENSVYVLDLYLPPASGFTRQGR